MNHHHYGHNNGYSQNETTNGKLLKSLIDRTSISKGDLVYDIGAGSATITEALLTKGAHVIQHRKRRPRCTINARTVLAGRPSIHHADFLQWSYPPATVIKSLLISLSFRRRIS